MTTPDSVVPHDDLGDGGLEATVSTVLVLCGPGNCQVVAASG
jgi:hypothetical protein